MNKLFTPNGWQDYIYWQTEDKKTLKKINMAPRIQIMPQNQFLFINDSFFLLILCSTFLIHRLVYDYFEK